MAMLKRHRTILLPAALVLAGAALRLVGLGGQGFWRDEAQGLFIALKPFPGGILQALSLDGHPPLYYFLMHFWMLIVGRSELAVQIFSALCGIAAIAAVWLLARRLYQDDRLALLAAGCAALLPLHVSVSRSARMYALVSLLATLALYLAYEAVLRGGLWRHVGLGLVSLALMYSHNWGVLVPAALNAWWVLMLLVYAPARRTWKLWLATQVVIGLCYLPWLPPLLAQRSALVVASTWSDVGSRLENLVRLMNELTGLYLPDRRPYFWIVFLGLGLLTVRLRRDEASVSLPLEPATLLVACGLALPLLLGLIVTPKSVGIIPNYVTIVAYPALCLALGRGVLALRRWWAVGLGIVVILFLWRGALLSAAGGRISSLREVAAFVEQRAGPGDVIIISPDYLATPFNWYYRGPQAQVAFPEDPGRIEEIIWAHYNERWAQAETRIEPTLAYVAQARKPGGRVWLVAPVESYPNQAMFNQIRALKAGLDELYRLEQTVTDFRGPVEYADVFVYGT